MKSRVFAFLVSFAFMSVAVAGEPGTCGPHHPAGCGGSSVASSPFANSTNTAKDGISQEGSLAIERSPQKTVVQGVDAAQIFNLIKYSGRYKGRLHILGFVTERPTPPIEFYDSYLAVGEGNSLNLNGNSIQLDVVAGLFRKIGIEPKVDASGGTTYVEYVLEIECTSNDRCIIDLPLTKKMLQQKDIPAEPYITTGQLSFRVDGQYQTGAGDLLRTNSLGNELEISTDGGSNWRTIFAHATIWRFSARASDKIWVGYRCGPEDACVSYTKDRGQSWVDLPYELPYFVGTLCTSKEGMNVAFGSGSGPHSEYFVSSDGGQTFHRLYERPAYCTGGS